MGSDGGFKGASPRVRLLLFRGEVLQHLGCAVFDVLLTFLTAGFRVEGLGGHTAPNHLLGLGIVHV
jgi:hypothetical protein